MSWLVAVFLAWLPLLALVGAVQTTKTFMQCQTLMASTAPFHIAYHTKTVTTAARDVTVAFTTSATSTVAFGPRPTLTRIKTSVSTVTATVTRPLDGSIFTTTTTKYHYQRHYFNVTSTLSLSTVSAQMFTINYHIPTPSGFTAINPPPPPPPPPPPAAPPSADELAPDQLVYVAVDGKLMPVKASQIDALLADPDKFSSEPADPIPIAGHDNPKHRRDESSSAVSTSREPTFMMGIRGVQMQSANRKPVAFPATVTCTKSFVAENTVWLPASTSATTVSLSPSTTTTTTLLTSTTTSTVPDRAASTTITQTVTSVLATTTTLDTTTTAFDTRTYTVTTTTTVHDACATSNAIGPLASNDTHIVNVYTHGPGQWTIYDRGASGSPADCCAECHLLAGRACLGSVFADGACFLLTEPGPGGKCSRQKPAGYFVARPAEERPRPGKRWPEYVVSNGPCGAFRDGGIGW